MASSSRRFRRSTPALAAGLTDRCWMVKDILLYLWTRAWLVNMAQVRGTAFSKALLIELVKRANAALPSRPRNGYC